MTKIVLFLVLAGCATVQAKPVAKPVPKPVPLPAIVDAADAADVFDAKAFLDRARAQAEVARLRYVSALRKFEEKHKVCVAVGDGWNEPDQDGRLHVRRVEKRPESCPLPPEALSAEVIQKLIEEQREIEKKGKK